MEEQEYLVVGTQRDVDLGDRILEKIGEAIVACLEMPQIDKTKQIHIIIDEICSESPKNANRPKQGDDAWANSVPYAILTGDVIAAGITVTTLLVEAGFAGSKGEAKRLILAGGVRLNDQRIDDPELLCSRDHVRDGAMILRAGKKRIFRFDVASCTGGRLTGVRVLISNGVFDNR